MRYQPHEESGWTSANVTALGRARGRLGLSMDTKSTFPNEAAVRVGSVRPKHPAQPVYLLDVTARRGERTRADGALWDGVLNATPDDTNDAPSPIEALMAALAGCLVRNLRSMADTRRITLERADLHLAATRSDDPPLVTSLIVDLDVVAGAEPERVQRMVEQALRYGTITRTVARACPLVINLSIGGAPATLDVDAILGAPAEEVP
jgi:uncharacterized OsmC-like protein